MKSVSIPDLKRSFNSIIREVIRGETIVITFEGKPIAEIIPYSKRQKKAIAKVKALRKTAIIGDLISPIDEKWEAI